MIQIVFYILMNNKDFEMFLSYWKSLYKLTCKLAELVLFFCPHKRKLI